MMRNAVPAAGGASTPVLVAQGTNDLRVNPVNGDQVIQQWLETNRLATAGMFTR